MGNTVSCCVSPSGSPKLPRQLERLDDYQISTDLSDDTGPYLQHISDREVPDGKFWWVMWSCFSSSRSGLLRSTFLHRLNSCIRISGGKCLSCVGEGRSLRAPRWDWNVVDLNPYAFDLWTLLKTPKCSVIPFFSELRFINYFGRHACERFLLVWSESLTSVCRVSGFSLKPDTFSAVGFLWTGQAFLLKISV